MTLAIALRGSIALAFSAVALAGSYTVSVVQTPSGLQVQGLGSINNSGQAAGYVNNGPVTQAFIGSPSGATLIPLPTGWSNSNALAINNFGQVAGTVNTGVTGTIL